MSNKVTKNKLQLLLGKRPTVWMHFRQIVGTVLRESGQALDRVGIRGIDHASTAHLRPVANCDPIHIFESNLSRHRQLMPLLKHGKPILSENISFLAPCSTLIGSVFVGENSSIWYKAVLKADLCNNGQCWSINNYEDLLKLQETSTKPTYTYSSDNKVATTTEIEQTQQQNNTTVKPWELIENEITNDPDEKVGGAIFIGNNTNIQDNCVVTSDKDHCVLGNNVTVGHNAQIHSATIGDNVIVGMSSLIKEGAIIEDNVLVGAGTVIESNTTVESGTLWLGNPGKQIRSLTEDELKQLQYQSNEYVNVATTPKLGLAPFIDERSELVKSVERIRLRRQEEDAFYNETLSEPSDIQKMITEGPGEGIDHDRDNDEQEFQPGRFQPQQQQQSQQQSQQQRHPSIRLEEAKTTPNPTIMKTDIVSQQQKQQTEKDEPTTRRKEESSSSSDDDNDDNNNNNRREKAA